jgi:hypothetical protein
MFLSSGRIAHRWRWAGQSCGVRRQDTIKRNVASGSARWIRLRRIWLEGRVTYGLGWFVMGLQMLIMPNRKLYVLITYMVGPLAVALPAPPLEPALRMVGLSSSFVWSMNFSTPALRNGTPLTCVYILIDCEEMAELRQELLGLPRRPPVINLLYLIQDIDVLVLCCHVLVLIVLYVCICIGWPNLRFFFFEGPNLRFCLPRFVWYSFVRICHLQRFLFNNSCIGAG